MIRIICLVFLRWLFLLTISFAISSWLANALSPPKQGHGDVKSHDLTKPDPNHPPISARHHSGKPHTREKFVLVKDKKSDHGLTSGPGLSSLRHSQDRTKSHGHSTVPRAAPGQLPYPQAQFLQNLPQNKPPQAQPQQLQGQRNAAVPDGIKKKQASSKGHRVKPQALVVKSNSDPNHAKDSKSAKHDMYSQQANVKKQFQCTRGWTRAILSEPNAYHYCTKEGELKKGFCPTTRRESTVYDRTVRRCVAKRRNSKKRSGGSTPLGGHCSVSSQCMDTMWCKDNKCECFTQYAHVGNQCVMKIEPGRAGCTINEQCSHVWPHSTCVGGTCRCPPNQRIAQTKDGPVCVTEGHCPTNQWTPKLIAAAKESEATCDQRVTNFTAGCDLWPALYDCVFGKCCPSQALVCIQPRDHGSGTLKLKRWYHDTLSDNCHEFDFKGAGGNANNFETEAQCTSYCERLCERGSPLYRADPRGFRAPVTCNLADRNPNAPCGLHYHCEDTGPIGVCCPTITYTCSADGAVPGLVTPPKPYNPGTGPAFAAGVQRYYWDDSRKTCDKFQYLGQGGNFNNFVTRDECQQFCTARSAQQGQPAPQTGGQPQPQGAPAQPGAQGQGQPAQPAPATQPGAQGTQPAVTPQGATPAQPQGVTPAQPQGGATPPQSLGGPPAQPQGGTPPGQPQPGAPVQPQGGTPPVQPQAGNQGVPQGGGRQQGAATPTQPVQGGTGGQTVNAPVAVPPQGGAQPIQTTSTQGGTAPPGLMQCDRGEPIEGLVCSNSNQCPLYYDCISAAPPTMGYCCPSKQVICTYPLDPGSPGGTDGEPVAQSVARWWYNYQSQICQQFVYLGLGGKANNFESEEDCNRYCDNVSWQARCPFGAPIRDGQGRIVECAIEKGNSAIQALSYCPRTHECYFDSVIFMCCHIRRCPGGRLPAHIPETNVVLPCTPGVENMCPDNFACIVDPKTASTMCCEPETVECPVGSQGSRDPSGLPQTCQFGEPTGCPDQHTCFFSTGAEIGLCCTRTSPTAQCAAGSFPVPNSEKPFHCIPGAAKDAPGGCPDLSDCQIDQGRTNGICCTTFENATCPSGDPERDNQGRLYECGVLANERIPKAAITHCGLGTFCHLDEAMKIYVCCQGQGPSMAGGEPFTAPAPGQGPTFPQGGQPPTQPIQGGGQPPIQGGAPPQGGQVPPNQPPPQGGQVPPIQPPPQGGQTPPVQPPPQGSQPPQTVEGGTAPLPLPGGQTTPVQPPPQGVQPPPQVVQPPPQGTQVSPPQGTQPSQGGTTQGSTQPVQPTPVQPGTQGGTPPQGVSAPPQGTQGGQAPVPQGGQTARPQGQPPTQGQPPAQPPPPPQSGQPMPQGQPPIQPPPPPQGTQGGQLPPPQVDQTVRPQNQPPPQGQPPAQPAPPQIGQPPRQGQPPVQPSPQGQPPIQPSPQGQRPVQPPQGQPTPQGTQPPAQTTPQGQPSPPQGTQPPAQPTNQVGQRPPQGAQPGAQPTPQGMQPPPQPPPQVQPGTPALPQGQPAPQSGQPRPQGQPPPQPAIQGQAPPAQPGQPMGQGNPQVTPPQGAPTQGNHQATAPQPQVTPQSIPPQGTPQGTPPQGTPQGTPPQGTPQGTLPQGTPQGTPPQGTPQGTPMQGQGSTGQPGTPQGTPPQGAPQATPTQGQGSTGQPAPQTQNPQGNIPQGQGGMQTGPPQGQKKSQIPVPQGQQQSSQQNNRQVPMSADFQSNRDNAKKSHHDQPHVSVDPVRKRHHSPNHVTHARSHVIQHPAAPHGSSGNQRAHV